MNSKIALRPNIKGNFTEWDGRMRFKWSRLKIPSFLRNNDQKREHATWNPAQEGWLKLNFDGASKGNPSPSGASCIIKDNRGDTIGKIAIPLPIDTNNIAEFSALHIGLVECKMKGIRKI